MVKIFTGMKFLLWSLSFFLLSCATKPASEGVSAAKPSTEIESAKTTDQIPEETPRRAAEVISFYRGNSDAEQALHALEKYDIGEMDLDSQLVYASLLRAMGRLDETREILDFILTENPQDSEALFGLALLEGAQGNIEARDLALEASLEADPDNADSWTYKGDLASKGKNWVEAGKLYQKALKIEEKHVEALSGLGWALANLEKEEEALQYLNQAVEEAPTYAYPLVDRSRLLVVLKKYGDAEKDLSIAIDLEPENLWHYLDRARIRLRYFEDYEGALADLTIVERLDADNFLGLVYLAGLHDAERRFDRALDYYQRVVEQRKNYIWAYPPLGKLEWIAGNYKAAAKWFARAAEEDDQEFSYNLLAALSYEKAGEQKKGRDILKSILRGLEKGSTKYEVVRFCIERGSDIFALNALNREKDENLRDRLWFYMGAVYGIGKNSKSEKAAYGKIATRKGELEYDMAYAAIAGL